jgi:hypothetical protein
MSIFDNVNITPKEKAQLGLPLPDRLSIFEIYDLWWTNKADAFIAYLEAMCKAYKEGNLIGERVENYQSNPLDSFRVMVLLTKKSPLNHGCTSFCFNTLIHKNNFILWLDSEGAPKPEGCLLAAWWKESEPLPEIIPADSKDDRTMTKLEKQRLAITNVIKLKEFNAMAIPDGEKGTIEMICKADYPLLFDRESSFVNAWKKSRDLFKMANHSSYAKRGK